MPAILTGLHVNWTRSKALSSQIDSLILIESGGQDHYKWGCHKCGHREAIKFILLQHFLFD